MSTGFDFASPEAQTKETATLDVKHPKKGDIGVTIEVAGKDSELYQEEFADYRKTLLRNAEDRESLNDDTARKLVAEFLARITLSWENISWEGEPMECTYDNAYKLYSDRRFTWLRDQVDSFASNRANFLGN